MKISLALVILVSSCLAACGTTPYSVIDGSRSSTTDRFERNVLILAIDGRPTPLVTIENIEPGLHVVKLRTVVTPRHGSEKAKTLEIQVEPCVRYVVVARHESTLRRGHWEPVLKEELPLSACSPSVKETGE